MFKSDFSSGFFDFSHFYQLICSYELKVEVSGSGWNSVTSVFITIENINDNPPILIGENSEIKINKFQNPFEINEIEVYVKNGTIDHVTTLNATDLDNDEVRKISNFQFHKFQFFF